jgi:hypothetical protein
MKRPSTSRMHPTAAKLIPRRASPSKDCWRDSDRSRQRSPGVGEWASPRSFRRARKRYGSAYGSRVHDLNRIRDQPIARKSIKNCTKGMHSLRTSEDGA